VHLSPSSVIYCWVRAVTHYCWEGNHWSGIALAMCHRLKWFIQLQSQGVSKGDEHSTNTDHGVWYSLAFFTFIFLSEHRYVILGWPSGVSTRRRRQVVGHSEARSLTFHRRTGMTSTRHELLSLMSTASASCSGSC